MKTTFYIFLIFVSTLNSQKKFNYREERHKFNINLIVKHKTNNTITQNINSNEEFVGRYLGKVISKTGVEYYIVVSSYVFDIKVLAKTENHIFIYNNKKQYIGYYYLSYINELPNKLEKNKLYFKNKDCKEESIINFRYGIPRAINLKCNNENNYYEFQN